MKSLLKHHLGLLFLALACFCGCAEDPVDAKNKLTVSRTELSFDSEGGDMDILLFTDAEEWFVRNPTDWVSVSPPKGTDPEATLTFSVSSKTIEPRQDTLLIFAGTADPVEIIVSQASSEYLYDLSVNFVSLSFKKGGNSTLITVTSEAPEWNLSTDVDWLEFDPETGGKGETKVTVSATGNESDDAREGTITLSGDKSAVRTIAVSQIGQYYPSYNTSPLPADMTGMESTAAEIAADMHLGWNIGNTLEALGGETAWGQPEITEQLVQLAKTSGFNAIRLPCSWNQYLEDQKTAKIKQSWLDRVKQVVEYCTDNDMYVILNIHWDGGWLENNITPSKQEENNAKQKAFWEQIATHLREFDERLLFAGTNEPNVETAAQMTVLNSYLQTFIDAVRSTGGKNTYRTLIVQGPSTDIEKTKTLMTSLPEDSVPNKLMAEVHFYTPYQFCLMNEDADWGKMFYYWGEDYHSTTDTERNADWGEESTIDDLFASMKSKFTSKGIPVILGEYGAMKRTNLTGEALELHLNSRAYYLEYVTRQALANGMIPFYWGAGLSDLFDRQSYVVSDQKALDAIVSGGQ